MTDLKRRTIFINDHGSIKTGNMARSGVSALQHSESGDLGLGRGEEEGEGAGAGGIFFAIPGGVAGWVRLAKICRIGEAF